MNRRDHAVVVVLALVLVGLGAAMALPAARPDAAVATPTTEATLPPPVTYREGVLGTVESITPVTARTQADRALVGLIFSGLVKLGPDNEFQPDLAESWTADESGKVWTFRIRGDATWQDGEPVTADDVVFTVDVLKNPDAAGAVASSWAEVTATAVDRHTVQLALASPIAGFLAAATQPLLPRHLLADVPFAELAADPFAHRPTGSGPYVLTRLDDTMAVLVPTALAQAAAATDAPGPIDPFATPDPAATPAAPIPRLERIEIHFFADAAALAAALEAGDIDATSALPPDEVARLAALPGLDRIRYPTTTLSAVILDLRPSHAELRDPRVRKALLAALDRDALVGTVLHGDALRADTLVPPGSWAFEATAAGTVSFDRKKAASLLSAAGWKRSAGKWTAPGGKAPYKLEILCVPDAANPALAASARFVRDAWASLGIGVDLVQLPAPELGNRLRTGKFGAAVVDIATGLEPDLFPLLASSQVRASGSNLSGYQDVTLDPLLEAARAVGTPEQRTAAWKALLAGLASREPILPLAWEDEVLLARGLEGETTRLIATPGDRFWDVLAWRLAADR